MLFSHAISVYSCYRNSNQFVIFKPLSYCFSETIGFDVKASFASRPMLRLITVWNFDVKTLYASRPVSRLIRWYTSDITKEFWEKATFSSMGLFMDWQLKTDQVISFYTIFNSYTFHMFTLFLRAILIYIILIRILFSIEILFISILFSFVYFFPYTFNCILFISILFSFV